MQTKELKERIEQGRRKAKHIELEKEKILKANLLAKIAEKKQTELLQTQKNVKKAQQVRILYTTISSFCLAGILIFSISCLASSYKNRGKFIVTESSECAGNGIISENCEEFKEIEDFLQKLFLTDSADSANFAKKCRCIICENSDAKREILEQFQELADKDFRIAYIQRDLKAGNFYVMCEFKDTGSYYLTLKKESQEIYLVSIEYYS